MGKWTESLNIFEGKDGKNILVLLLKSEDAKKRHLELMEEHKTTYDYPEYKPHITLS